jgi:hypothetical protein
MYTCDYCSEEYKISDGVFCMNTTPFYQLTNCGLSLSELIRLARDYDRTHNNEILKEIMYDGVEPDREELCSILSTKLRVDAPPPDQAHFICSRGDYKCINDLVNKYLTFIDHSNWDGRISCCRNMVPGKMGECKSYYDTSYLLEKVSRPTRLIIQDAIIRHAEKLRIDKEKREKEKKDRKEASEEEIEDVFYECMDLMEARCPKCETRVDWKNSYLVTCRGCRVCFCAVCLYFYGSRAETENHIRTMCRKHQDWTPVNPACNIDGSSPHHSALLYIRVQTHNAPWIEERRRLYKDPCLDAPTILEKVMAYLKLQPMPLRRAVVERMFIEMRKDISLANKKQYVLRDDPRFDVISQLNNATPHATQFILADSEIVPYNPLRDCTKLLSTYYFPVHLLSFMDPVNFYDIIVDEPYNSYITDDSSPLSVALMDTSATYQINKNSSTTQYLLPFISPLLPIGTFFIFKNDGGAPITIADQAAMTLHTADVGTLVKATAAPDGTGMRWLISEHEHQSCVLLEEKLRLELSQQKLFIKKPFSARIDYKVPRPGMVHEDIIFLLFRDILRKCHAVIAGGFVLNAVSPFPIVSKQDIDLYVNLRNAKACIFNLLELGFKMVTTHMSPAYDDSFMRKNNIIARISFDHFHDKGNHPPMDVMIIRDDTSIESVVTHFDLTICQIWYDGYMVNATHWRDIQTKHGSLQPDYHRSYISGNTFIHNRINKYKNRGYTIDTPADINPVVVPLLDELKSKYERYRTLFFDLTAKELQFKQEQIEEKKKEYDDEIIDIQREIEVNARNIRRLSRQIYNHNKKQLTGDNIDKWFILKLYENMITIPDAKNVHEDDAGQDPFRRLTIMLSYPMYPVTWDRLKEIGTTLGFDRVNLIELFYHVFSKQFEESLPMYYSELVAQKRDLEETLFTGKRVKKRAKSMHKRLGKRTKLIRKLGKRAKSMRKLGKRSKSIRKQRK